MFTRRPSGVRDAKRMPHRATTLLQHGVRSLVSARVFPRDSALAHQMARFSCAFHALDRRFS